MRRFFMSRSEFRYNKRRKHYAYLFKDIGVFRKNILLSSKAYRKWKGKLKKNILLFRHPNKNSSKTVYVIPIIYIDSIDCFDVKKLKWCFDINDKRKIKRLKKGKK